jgi:glutathione S-transferase
MPEYKLYYFSRVHRGRAEGIRLLLNYKGIPFEDVRISFEEWPSKMSCNLYVNVSYFLVLAFKFRQLPVLGYFNITHI